MNGSYAPQSMTHPYWTPPQGQLFQTIKYENTMPGDLGFRNPIPVPLPATLGFYGGSNESELDMPKKLTLSSQPEYFLRGNYLPTIKGKPRVNMYLPMYNYSRDAHSVSI